MSDWYTQSDEIERWMDTVVPFHHSAFRPIDRTGDWIKEPKPFTMKTFSIFMRFDSDGIFSLVSFERVESKIARVIVHWLLFSLHDRFLFLMMILFVAAFQIKWTFYGMKLTLSIDRYLIRNRLNLAGIIRSIRAGICLKLGTEQQRLRPRERVQRKSPQFMNFCVENVVSSVWRYSQIGFRFDLMCQNGN